MKTNLRLHAIILGSSCLPLLVFAVCAFVLNCGYPRALLIAAASAAAAAFLAAAAVKAGLAAPMETIAANLKLFKESDYHLKSVIPKAGWPEAANLISAINRLMLELNAYRAFQLYQVVEERGKAQALLETITDGVLLIDDRGGLIYCNHAALNLLGIPKISPDVVIPSSVSNSYFLSALTGMLASDEKHLRAELAVPLSEETPDLLKNYRIISNQFMLATLKRPGRVIIIRDITNEKETEEAKETFFHMITHDMRAPLTSIRGFAQLLMQALGPSPKTDIFLQSILRSAGRLSGMIDDILNTAKLERGNLTLKLDAIDAGALTARIREEVSPAATRKNITLSAPPPPAEIRFMGDTALLERVIMNLLGNSLKFTPPGGSVSLSCRETAGEVYFSVEDTGPGIPESSLTDIFEKYYQMEEHKHMGSGLGLAMCKMAVELHKGRIWAESKPGKGSRFIFTVPKTLEAPAQDAPPAP